MSDWDDIFQDLPFYSKRRRRGTFSPSSPDNPFGPLDEIFERMFREMTRNLPKEAWTEQKLPDGGTARQFGPFVYGYSMTIGPDGKPVIREFGNVKSSQKPGVFGLPRASLEPADSREPLIDVTDDKDSIKVAAELPGVEKKDVKLACEDKTLIISVDTPTRKYHKEVDLPSTVDPDASKATCNNGVLEVTLRKKKTEPRGKSIQMV